MMSGIGTALFVCLAAFNSGTLLDPAPPRPGETLHLRLHTRLSSRATQVGQPFSAVLIRPLMLHDETAIPAGARVEGAVSTVRGVGLGLKHERARLGLSFHRLVLPDGSASPLEATLAAIDNAREELDTANRIRGIRATQSFGERMNVRLGGLRLSGLPIAYKSLVASYPVELLPLWFANAVIFGLTDPEIDLPPGAEFQVRLKEPWPHPARFPTYLGEQPDRLAHREAELAHLVETQPALSRFAKSGAEADPVNVVLLGSPAAPFRAAGWRGADPRSRRSCFRALRAIATGASYPTGPMNPLLLDDRPPDAEWQKGLNTFAKRHHLRAWGARELWEGEPVWLLAATHDTGLVVLGDSLTHAIDHQIDRERDKVVADLLLTGCVDAVTYVHRPVKGQRPWQTDGRVAVVRLNQCANPVRWDADLDPASLVSPAQRPLSWRLLQRLTLNARNSLLRENHAYRAYDLVRHILLWRRMNQSPEPSAARATL